MRVLKIAPQHYILVSLALFLPVHSVLAQLRKAATGSSAFMRGKPTETA